MEIEGDFFADFIVNDRNLLEKNVILKSDIEKLWNSERSDDLKKLEIRYYRQNVFQKAKPAWFVVDATNEYWVYVPFSGKFEYVWREKAKYPICFWKAASYEVSIDENGDEKEECSLLTFFGSMLAM